MVVAADAAGAPVALGGNTLAREAPGDQALADGAHRAGLTGEIGLAVAGRLGEQAQPIDQGAAWGDGGAAAMEPLDVDIGNGRRRLALGLVPHLKDGHGAGAGGQAFQHRQDGGQAGFVADEQVPVGARVDHRAAAGAMGEKGVAQLGGAGPAGGGAVPVLGAVQGEIDVDELFAAVKGADGVVAPSLALRGGKGQDQVLAGAPGEGVEVFADEADAVGRESLRLLH